MGKDLINLGKRYGIQLFIALDVFWFLLPVPWWQVLLGIVIKYALWRSSIFVGKMLRPYYQRLQIKYAGRKVRRQRPTAKPVLAKIRGISTRRYDAN